MHLKTGITSYGSSLPICRLAVEDVINVWRNTDLSIIHESLGVKTRTVLQPDEDVITLGADACHQALSRTASGQLDAIYLGTCTNPYDSRSSAAIILEMLGTGQNTYCADVQFSGKSGTSAMQLCYAMVKAGLAENALAVGADTISRHTAPGDLTESYAGAGAAAMIFGTENVIAEVNGMFSLAEDLADNIRPQGERYIRSGMGLGSDKNNLGIHRHIEMALKGLLAKTGESLASFDHVVFQQPTPSTLRSMARRLGLQDSQTAFSQYAGTTGDTGAASPMLGLARVLDHASPGERILMVSYGFGAGSDAISFTVTEHITSYPRHQDNVDRKLANTSQVDYGTAAKYEFKFLRPDYALTAYL